MQMTGEQRIAAPRGQVWAALNDPDVLRRCIPGCQSLEKEAGDRLRAVVEVKIGPIGARFNGAVTLSDLDPPNGYTLSGEGQGGTVGFAKGAAKVRLFDEGGGTRLTYEVEAQIGGRMAQLGGALVDATAKQLAGRFFDQFGQILGAPTETPASAAAPVAAPAARTTPVGRPAAPTPPVPVIGGLAIVLAALVGYLIGHAGRGTSEADWMGLAIGLLLLIVAAAGFEYGRRASAPTVVLDAALLARLTEERKP